VCVCVQALLVTVYLRQEATGIVSDLKDWRTKISVRNKIRIPTFMLLAAMILKMNVLFDMSSFIGLF
jgi:hypothetical protein